MSRTIGFIGLGNMGKPMADNIAAVGLDLVCFDVAGTEGRAPVGATTAGSVGQVAQCADTVLLSLPDGDATLSVVEEILAASDRRLSVVVDLSTIGPVAARSAAERLLPASVVYCDGPVSGGVAGARAATIALMFAGPSDVLTEHRPVFDAVAGNVFHVGQEAGLGQTMKLVNNVLSATALAASSEAMALGRAFGLDLNTMLDVINVSSGRNTATSDKFPNRVLTGTYDTGFLTRLMAKDVRLFNSVAAGVGTRSEVMRAMAATWNELEREMPDSDFSEIWKFTVGEW